MRTFFICLAIIVQDAFSDITCHHRNNASQYGINMTEGSTESGRDDNGETPTSLCQMCSCKDEVADCSNKNYKVIPAFVNFSTSITEVNLSLNTYNCIQMHKFRDFPGLRKLNLSFVKLQKMENGIFSSNDNLTTLYLNHNKLKTLPTDWFSSRNFLQKLWLDDNLIEDLNDGNFKNFRWLTQLHLRRNQIKKLHESYFRNLTALKSLYLHSNVIEEIEANSFPLLEELTLLDLNNNTISRIAPNSFMCLPKLEELIVSGNPLKKQSADVFQNLNHLETLHLQFSLIEDLDGGNLGNLPMLIILILRGNRIKRLQKGYFQNLTALTWLDLDKNAIEKIQTDSFPCLQNLIGLHLQENEICNIEPASFTSLPNLRILDLSGNRLKILSSGVFKGLNRLFFLSLNNNSIECIDDNVFWEIQNLTYLDLFNNSVKRKKLSSKTFEPLTSLKYISFDDVSLCSLTANISNMTINAHKAKCNAISSVEHLLGNIVLRTSVWIMGIVACAGNILVLLGRMPIKEFNSIHSIYITNLSVSDFLMGVYLMIIAIIDTSYSGAYARYQGDWMMSPLCKFSGVVNATNSVSSVFILSLITWERVVNITKPLTGLQRSQNKKQAIYISIVIWIVSLSLALAPVVFQGSYFEDDFYSQNGVCLGLYINDPLAKGWEYSAALFMSFNTIGLIFIIFSYVKMFWAIKSSGVGLGSTQNSKNRDVAIKVAIIVGTDCLCWIPVIIVKLMALFGVPVDESVNVALAIFVLPINSALNPLIYTSTTRNFMKQLNWWLERLSKKPFPDNIDLSPK